MVADVPRRRSPGTRKRRAVSAANRGAKGREVPASIKVPRSPKEILWNKILQKPSAW